MSCKAEHNGTGARYWMRCACGFVWLGTYAGDRHRRMKAREAHAAYLERIHADETAR